jgi:nitroimidazol reductase NimA-like FMN-containing flavoprotein (pyridoxamine 5'-phosphate oxidase superfamily)
MPESVRPLLDARSSVGVERDGSVVLDRAECLRLLGTATLGRIGLTSRALPMVLPVSFWFDGERILIHARADTKLAAATLDAVVAFEVDDVHPRWHTGWSVMVTGIAHHVVDPGELEAIAAVPRVRWASQGGGHVVSIVPELISGRRV